MSGKVSEAKSMLTCDQCGMRADRDQAFHASRYGHWPTVGAHSIGCVCESCATQEGNHVPSE